MRIVAVFVAGWLASTAALYLGARWLLTGRFELSVARPGGRAT